MAEGILNVVTVIISTLVVLINIALLISVIKMQKKMHTVKSLSIQLLVSTIIYSFSFTLISLIRLNVGIDCHIFNVENSFCGTSTELSLLSITLNSYFILTNNFFFHKRKQIILVIMIIVTWAPSIGFLILYINFRDAPMAQCIIVKMEYWGKKSLPEYLIELVSVIICLVLLVKVCMLKVQNDKELQISKKKTVSKIVSYIIMMIIGIVLKYFAFGVFFNSGAIQSCLFFVLSIYFLILNYVFLWTKQLKESLLIVFCCRSNEETDGTGVKNNQKELALQYDIAEDIAEPNFEEEEPTDN